MTESTTASSAAKSATQAASDAAASASAAAKSAAPAADRSAESARPAPPPRTVAQIQADIASNQQRLADTVDELSERIAPEALAEEAKARVKAVFVHPDGSPKGKPIAIIGGTIAGLVVLRAIFRD